MPPPHQRFRSRAVILVAPLAAICLLLRKVTFLFHCGFGLSGDDMDIAAFTNFIHLLINRLTSLALMFGKLKFLSVCVAAFSASIIENKNPCFIIHL